MRTVTLNATGKTVPLGAYVAAMRTAIAHPDRQFRHGLTTWWPVSGAEVRREFMDGVHERINRHLPEFGKGRKWSADWQRAVIQTAAFINTPRVVVNWLPVDLKARLAHRLRDRSDY